MRKFANSYPCTSRGYIFPSLVMVFALMVSIFAYNKYYLRVQNTSDTGDVIDPVPASLHVQKPDEEIQQIRYLLSRTSSDLELRLEELEKRFSEFSETAKSGASVTSTTDYTDNELLAHLDEWQSSVNRRIGLLQDGFESSFESIEARISSPATTGEYITAYMPEPTHTDQLEERVANLEQRLTQVTENYAAQITHMENSLEFHSADRPSSLHEDATSFQATDQTQLHLLLDQFDQATSEYNARMKMLEIRLAETNQSSGKRFKQIEKTLQITAGRLERLAANVATAADLRNTATIRAANKTITAEPPAAVQPPSRSNNHNNEPAISAHQGLKPQTQKIITRHDLSKQNNPATTGGWVVNLASYAREGIADKKLEDFKNQGVIAEKLAATVRGKTMYRLRVTGFDSIESARSMTPALKQKLGLQEVWISRN